MCYLSRAASELSECVWNIWNRLGSLFLWRFPIPDTLWRLPTTQLHSLQFWRCPVYRVWLAVKQTMRGQHPMLRNPIMRWNLIVVVAYSSSDNLFPGLNAFPLHHVFALPPMVADNVSRMLGFWRSRSGARRRVQGFLWIPGKRQCKKVVAPVVNTLPSCPLGIGFPDRPMKGSSPPYSNSPFIRTPGGSAMDLLMGHS